MGIKIADVVCMFYDSFHHHRRSIRLKNYDYSTEGAYFLTICTQNREMILRSDPVCRMIHNTWNDLIVRFSDVRLDEFVIMPNHIHGIIWIVGAGPRACPNEFKSQQDIEATTGIGQPRRVAPTLFQIVHWFKSMTTTRYRHGVSNKQWASFEGRLWQRNYYERIIRNDDELYRTRQYIIDNPKNWEKDPENIS